MGIGGDDGGGVGIRMDCLAGKEWSEGPCAFALSFCCARCKVQGARGQKGSSKPAKHQSSTAPLRSGHGLLIFDCVHGPDLLELTAHWPTPIGCGRRELGTLLPLDTPLFTSWQVHLDRLVTVCQSFGVASQYLCSCLHWLSVCLLPASS